jgi:cysteine desulfurase
MTATTLWFSHGAVAVFGCAAMDIINLDNNATTPLLPEVWEAMRPFMLTDAGNAASSHALGRRARRALEDARETVAQLLDASADEILFTSGATEANNLAIFGLAGAVPGTIVSSAIEHPCVTEPVQQLAKRGFAHRPLPVTRRGTVEPFPDNWPSDTRLACLMLANHETGAIQPVGELATLLDGAAPFHCDAAAAAGKMPISFRKLGVTSLTVTAHKFHGPKGIGALLLSKHAKLQPLFFGGHQQHAQRPGTEPVALAVGLAAALKSAVHQMETHRRHCLALRHRFLQLLRAGAEPVVLNGPEEGGLAHTLNLSFPGCAADVMLMNLDLAAVACATGSACSSGSLLPSPVLQAMGVPGGVLRSALRFSLSGLTTAAEIDEASQRIIMVANKLRSKSTSN